jgi:fluoroquinolone transport system permease protein
MSELSHLLKHDFRLLNRNRIIQISVLVTLIYIAVFKGLSSFGDMDQVLVLVIFNDPALLGFLFIGVMILFEKNENTLQALAVSPFNERYYILSKSLSLTVVSTACCLAMAFASHGTHFNFIHFISASILTSMLFSFLGFIVVAGENSFNHYILKALGYLVLLSVPFVGYFDLVSSNWFVAFPTQPAIDAFDASFDESASAGRIIYAYAALIGWTLITYFLAVRLITKNIKK